MAHEMIDKIPPQSLEAEMSYLGSLLLDKEALIKAIDLVQPEDFYKEANAVIFESVLELYEKSEPIDLLTLSNRLTEKGLLDSIGGRSYLVELTNNVATASNVVHYASIIHRKSTRRRLLTAAHEISRLSYQEEGSDLDVILDEAQQHLFGVSQTHFKQAFSPIRTVLSDAFERIDELHKNQGTMRGVPSGFTDLDRLLGGLQKSDLIIVGARPSVGKTTFVMDIVRQAAIRHKVPVGVFSLEMSKEQLVDRMLSSEANVDLWRIRTGKLNDNPDADDFARIGHAIGTLSEAPIYIDDTPSNNIMQIRTKARRLQAEHGLGMIVIDYLQLMESHGDVENRVQEVAKITRGLKGIARELNIPVIALSQLSRNVEQDKPAIPKLSHLRESGSIEQDADIVMFIYRKAADRNYQLDSIPPDERRIAEIHIAKHRNGPVGVVKLLFNDACVSFRNLEKGMLVPPDAEESAAARPNGGLKPKSAFTRAS
jgi:replicative DNA helicase